MRQVRGRVPGIQHHQRRRVSRPLPAGGGQVAEQIGNLRDGGIDMVLSRAQPPGLDRIHPRGGPPPHAHQHAQRPARQVPVPASTPHLHHHQLIGEHRVRAGQRRHVDPEHQRITLSRRRHRCHLQPPQPPGIYLAPCQGVIHRSVPAAELRLQRQLRRRAHRPLRAQHRVAQLEQRVRPRGEALMQLTAEPRQAGKLLDATRILRQTVHHGLCCRSCFSGETT